MMLLLRIGTASDPIQNKFNAEEATKSYYNLAPYHKEYKIESKTLLKPESPPHPYTPQRLLTNKPETPFSSKS